METAVGNTNDEEVIASASAPTTRARANTMLANIAEDREREQTDHPPTRARANTMLAVGARPKVKGQVDPWIAGRSLGSVRIALQLAESMELIRKDRVNADEMKSEAYECSPSLKMLTLMREIRNCRQQLSEVNLKIQLRLQDRETRDIAHIDVLELRIAKINELTSHLKELVSNRQLLIARLKQPFVNGYIPIDMQYQRYAADYLPRLIPTLSELSAQLENFEWIVRLKSIAGDIGGIIADVTATLTTIQDVVRLVTQVREALKRMNGQ